MSVLWSVLFMVSVFSYNYMECFMERVISTKIRFKSRFHNHSDLKMAHEGPVIYIKMSRGWRRGEKTTLNDGNGIISNNYVMQ